MAATDPVDNLARLIRCASVTPKDDGALATLGTMLSPLGFTLHPLTMQEDGTPDIANLYARLGTEGRHLMFAGHTDVVPTGDDSQWSHPPFAAEIADGVLYGRGAVDMKGGIACFVAALARHIERTGPIKGSVSLLITGDEEGPAINGTVKLLEWAAGRGETWDGCIVGEPTNPNSLGDMIKIGRRGSLSGRITVKGVQGHAAYPHLADNPLRGIIKLTEALLDPPFDHGTDDFQPSNLEITSIDTGNTATNVIPARATAAFNIRFNDSWTAETLRAEIRNRLERAAADAHLRPGRAPVSFDLDFTDRPSDVFLTRDNALVSAMTEAIGKVTGRQPQLSTTGGTSDARFIKNYCPVIEFGLVGQTMHMIDERVPVAELEDLTRIYEAFLAIWFADDQS